MKKFIAASALCFCATFLFAQSDTARLMRFPTIYNDQVVFSYAGDLYSVNKAGGTAQKLTNDIGYEMFSRFSPDGKNIAFTGQYDGNTEVYMMPAEGGSPVRLTYTATLGRDDIGDRMGPNNIVMTWRDNDHVVFRSRMHSFNDFQGALYLASTDGAVPEQLPFNRGGFCSYSPDKKQLAFNQVFREFRTWKYYEGGMADDIWIYDFASKQTINITNNTAQDMQPMWAGNKIYFLSDRDRTMNLFCYDVTTKAIRKVTNYTDYDIKFPSLGNNAIVWERGGWLYYMDLATEEVHQINVMINSDFIYSRSELVDATKNTEGYDLGPDGNRMLLDARGDIFTIPAEDGITRNLNENSSGSHERNATWSADGNWIAYVSDASGEDEIYMTDQTGNGTPQRLTTNGDNYKYAILWSPDSKKIMWADRKQDLYYIDVTTKAITKIDHSDVFEFNDYTWSPDSKWIAYSKPENTQKGRIFLYNLSTKISTPVTDGWFDAYNPAFSSDGKYLYLASNRDFNPTFSSTDMSISYNDMTKVYLITLSNETADPFAPKNDEVEKSKTETTPVTTDSKTSTTKNPTPTTETKDIKIDLDGIMNRMVSLPIDASSYFGITGIGNSVYYLQQGMSDHETMLKRFDLDDKEEKTIGAFNNYQVSSNNKKMLLVKDGHYYIVDLPMGKTDVDDAVNTSNCKVWVDKHAEWQQIFTESWRQMRDFFWDPTMSGVDWKAIYNKYQPLVKYVNHRSDLTYVIGEMIGELSTGHSYCGGGDAPKADRINMGLLGATFHKDGSGYFQLDKILNGANWDESLRSPLTEIGLNIHTGDYIIAINGKPTTGVMDMSEMLINTADKQVQLTVNSKPSAAGAHDVIIIPIKSESSLYYYNWVQHNIAYVDSVSHGQVGYIHIPNMGEDGLNMFMKLFYPQINKRALIIDDRGNGGGFVSPLITERLAKQLVFWDITRNGVPTTDPETQWGPKVCLINEYSASDGDIFPYRFKTYHLGKVIGKRSWGGVVGIRGSLPLVDGGFLNRPEFSRFTANDGWSIEGHGVDPDIVVENDPAKEYAGIDQQLDAAIQEILTELKTWPQQPPVPPYKDKTK